jgi:hypothetical protein
MNLSFSDRISGDKLSLADDIFPEQSVDIFPAVAKLGQNFGGILSRG